VHQIPRRLSATAGQRRLSSFRTAASGQGRSRPAYSFAIAEVEVGESSYRHRLRQTEIYFILNGRGRVHVDGETRELGVGEVCVIPAEAEQWIDNIGDECLRFVAVVSPPWRAEDDERL
ncbi:unnamed protein product, partial [Phaeothamnion confervicola]